MRHIFLASLSSAEQVAAVQEAVAVLARGGLVVYPTETMYGIAADASNPDAVTRLLQFKNRPAGKAISVLVADQAQAEEVVELNQKARNIYQAFLPGPVTVISKSRGILDARLESEIATLGVRISSHPLAAQLAHAYAKPVTATSANASGKARPYAIQTMLSGLSERQQGLIDLIIDVGELPHNEPSTVIDTTQEVQEIVRVGVGFSGLADPFHSSSETQTKEYGAKLMKGLLHSLPEKAVVFALEGDLGAGKTQFAKGVATALGITQPINSPTYTLVKEYENGPVRLAHLDLWRTPELSPEEISLDDYLKPNQVVVVEWAGVLLAYLRSHPGLTGYRLFFEITSPTERVITIGDL